MANVNDLAGDVKFILQTFADATDDVVKDALSATITEGLQKLKTEKPSGAGRYRNWAEYQKGWVKSESKHAGVFQAIAHNPEHYRLTHLLENGHVLRQGGRAKAFPHIAPVQEWAGAEFEKRVKEGVEKI